MTINVVIISHNQCDYILKMKDALGDLSSEAIFVLDRCNDNSEKICKENNIKYVKTPWWWIGRHTSSCRNLGLEYCYDFSDVLFLDGDRYPKTPLDFSKLHSDIMLLKVEHDNRDIWNNFNQHYGTVNNGFYSCGVLFTRYAINRIIEFQGELFPTKVEKQWGIEDTYLGDVCYHLNLSCELNNNIRLNGFFDRIKFDSFNVLKKRLKLRDKLNVKW